MLQQIGSMKRLQIVLVGLLIIALLVLGIRTAIFFNQAAETPPEDFTITQLDDQGQLLVDVATANLAERLGISPAEVHIEAVGLPSASGEPHTITLRVEEAIYVYEGQEDQVRPVDFVAATPTIPLEPLAGTGADIIETLRAEGLTVEAAGVVEQPFFTVVGQVFEVNADSQLQIYQYDDVAQAKTETARISPNGLAITSPEVQDPKLVEWLVSPHFYQEGRWVVLYLGNQPKVLDVLAETLGPQFAGSEVEALR